MHAFRNSARRKHFVGGNGDLDHGFIRQDVGILVSRERSVVDFVFAGARRHAADELSVTGRIGRGQCFRNDGRGRRSRYLWRMERGRLDARARQRQEQRHKSSHSARGSRTGTQRGTPRCAFDAIASSQ